MSDSPSLDSVAQAFKAWRDNQPSGRSKTPIELRQQAIALLADHSISQVIKRLGLSHSALKRWQQTTDTVQPIKTPFITLPMPESVSAPLCITLCLPNDTHMVIEGDLSSDQLMGLVQAIQSPKGAA
ncbi:helix-turn-helix domain-containing protein [Spartinivicinus poritis]|uniref:Helix-turn-helix domain containing protein n=1 Tax=Spartinivicinus poritis TaxID=2994640 RepID=A0ABT5UHX2_9GAMM|nr:helix-turn-helix domain-containing protein [Spartinivicinus sp. A2-2]MDE1465951.1 helix-turn-helix domain containing protein [Spartinivicinus sp. A2-2]